MTKVYGQSDDLIEFEGDVDGEISSYGNDNGVLLACSDGTILCVRYHDAGFWGIKVMNTGTLFDRVDTCVRGPDDPDDGAPSDAAYFKDGLKWALSAADFERVR